MVTRRDVFSERCLQWSQARTHAKKMRRKRRRIAFPFVALPFVYAWTRCGWRRIHHIAVLASHATQTKEKKTKQASTKATDACKVTKPCNLGVALTLALDGDWMGIGFSFQA
mmetsp:Transcript_14497/g.36698  ORF Transcript_14497/g.36698 Transcript_14497/m.36698 type:complete len:112 (+) Transcript_14497:566-901(+)